MNLSKIKQFVKQNGDKFIFVENDEPEIVVMSFHEYENLASRAHMQGNNTTPVRAGDMSDISLENSLRQRALESLASRPWKSGKEEKMSQGELTTRSQETSPSVSSQGPSRMWDFSRDEIRQKGTEFISEVKESGPDFPFSSADVRLEDLPL